MTVKPKHADSLNKPSNIYNIVIFVWLFLGSYENNNPNDGFPLPNLPVANMF